MNNLVKEIANVFKLNADDAVASGMKAYMKNQFDFYGIKSPLRKELQKPFLEKSKLPKIENVSQIAIECWQYPKREMHYFALDLLDKVSKKLSPQHLILVEELVQSKSWWDTVDLISTKVSGTILWNNPERINEFASKWNLHPNMWINRMGILFQLKYKQKTNSDILFHHCLTHASSNEFFIQKAIGWALREYSKTNPLLVQSFIEKNNFKPLSVREGMRIILKTNL